MGADADLVKRLSDEVFIKGNMKAFDEIVSADFVSHDPPLGASPTRDGFRGVAQAVTSGFTKRAFEFDDFIPTSDGRLVENWAMTGTHTGEVFGLPPSNKEVRVRGTEIWRCANGKIVEHWGTVDMGDVVQKAMG